MSIRKKNPRHAVKGSTLPYAILIAGIGLLFAAYILFSNPASTVGHRHTEPEKGDAVTEMTLRTISSLFVCACGSCSGESLEICSCEQAARERQEIRGLITQGKPQNEIVKVIGEKYGGLKASMN